MAGPSFNLYAIRRGRLIVHEFLRTRYLHTRLILHIYNGVHPPQICAFMYTVNCFLTQLSYCTIICTENNRLLPQILLFSLAKKKAPFSHFHGIQALLIHFYLSVLENQCIQRVLSATRQGQRYTNHQNREIIFESVLCRPVSVRSMDFHNCNNHRQCNQNATYRCEQT